MHVVLVNDTRADTNPGCQATVSTLVRQLGAGLDARVSTRPRGEGYQHFAALAGTSRAHCPEAWHQAVTALASDAALTAALSRADLVVANLEGTFHHHTVGALALGGTIAVAHRLGRPLWAVNGTVEAIDPWLLAATLAPAARISVREPRSARWLRARGIAATSAADAAFLAETFMARASAPLTRSAVFYTPGVLHGTAASVDAAIAEVIADLDALRVAGWTPTFVQFDDREAPLADAARRHGCAVDDARARAWSSFGAYLRRFALVVSGRYHVLIFAAMAGVPLLARPSNTHKIEGLLELLDRPDAFAADSDALAALLRRGLPPPVTLDTIRACQARARTQLPDSPPFVTGLDWSAAADLPQVMTRLQASAPADLDVVVATTPWDGSAGPGAPVRTVEHWRAVFAAAGFEVARERVVPHDTPTDRPAWRAAPHVNPLADPLIGERRAFTLRRGMTPRQAALDVIVGPPAAAAAAPHVRIMLADSDAFERLAPVWLALPPGTCSMVVRPDPADPAWSAAIEQIAAWCESHGVAVWRTHDPDVLDWDPPATRRLLVVPDYVGSARPRACHGLFIAAALARGWSTLVAAAKPTAPVHAAVPSGSGERAALRAAIDGVAVGTAPRLLRVTLFGASTLGRQVAARLATCQDIAVCGVCDNDTSRWHTSFEGLTVLPPTAAAFESADVVLVSSQHADAIVAQVTAAGFGTRLLLDWQALARGARHAVAAAAG